MKEKDLITELPESIDSKKNIKLDVRSYGGYSGVSYEGKEMEMFYWFFESEKFHPDFSRDDRKIGETPIIMWFNGGPGAPSTLGLFLENGPYRMLDDTAGTLKSNPYSWNRETHLLYFDQPIGTGYSYVKGEDPEKTFAKSEEELSSIIYLALSGFFDKHPQYAQCPVYIAGESYAGKYVPNIALKIHEMNNSKDGIRKRINLKGISIGDGWINPELQLKIYIDYAYTLGYLDKKSKDAQYKNYKKYLDACKDEDWQKAYEISNKLVEDVSLLGGGFNVYDIRSFSDISMKNVELYMESKRVKEILNIPEELSWKCADNKGPVAEALIKDNMEDSSHLYSEFIGHKEYRVLMYAGTFDTACGALSTETILNNILDEWQYIDRYTWANKGNVTKGFVKSGENLTEVIIPGSGHQVPYYKPEISLEMIYNWIFQREFDLYLPNLKTKK